MSASSMHSRANRVSIISKARSQDVSSSSIGAHSVRDSFYDYDSYNSFTEEYYKLSNHKAALERKFNSYDYQDISDFKVKSSKTAKLRASISGATSIRSAGSKKTSKSAKFHREMERQSLPAPNRRYSSLVISQTSRTSTLDAMAINMHSVALSSAQPKHMHYGFAQDDQTPQTNYEKQRLLLYKERKALGPRTPYDIAKSLQQTRPPLHHSRSVTTSYQSSKERFIKEQVTFEPIKTVRAAQSTPMLQSNSSKNHHHRQSQNHHNSRSSRSFDQRSATSQKSSLSLQHHNYAKHLHQLRSHHHRSNSGSSRDYHSSHGESDRKKNEDPNDQVYLIGGDSCILLDDDQDSVMDVNSVFDRPAKLSTSSVSSTPLTSPESSPLNKTVPFEANNGSFSPSNQQSYILLPAVLPHTVNANPLSSIVEVSTPKDVTTFKRASTLQYKAGLSTYDIPEEQSDNILNSRVSFIHNKSGSALLNKEPIASIAKKSSRLSLKSKLSQKNSSQCEKLSSVASPKAVFSLEDTLKADEEFRNNLPTREEFHKSIAANMTKPVPQTVQPATSAKIRQFKKSKKNNNSGGIKGFFSGLFGRKERTIDKRKIRVINEKIGVC